MKRAERRFLVTLIVAAGMVSVCAASAMAADHPLPGTRLVLRQTDAGVRAKYVATGLVPMPMADPQNVGARFRIYNPATGEDSGDLTCSPGAWITSDDAMRCRVRLADPPQCDLIQTVVLTGQKIKVRARCLGTFSLDEASQGGLAARLTIGTDQYCSLFDRAVIEDQPGVFSARGAPAPNVCPSPPPPPPPPPFTPPSLVRFTSGHASGYCGVSEDAGGAPVRFLACGGLYFGGGFSSLPLPTRMPEQAFGYARTTCANAECSVLTVSAATAADVPGPVADPMRHCSAKDCLVGPPVPLANSGTSKCGINRAASDITGTIDVATGAMSVTLPIASEVYLTSNGTQPCPLCIGGTLGVVGSGTCDPAWTSGDGPAPAAGSACTPGGLVGTGLATSHDCVPPPSQLVGTVTGFLGPLPALETASVSQGPCPGFGGAFGDEGAVLVRETGTPAGNLADWAAHPVVGVSTFCVPASEGSLAFLVNTAADLPGPGAVSVVGTVQLLP